MLGNKRSKQLNINSRRLIFAALISVFVIVGAVAAINILTTERNYAAAQSEYTELRNLAPPPASAQTPQSPQTPDTTADSEQAETTAPQPDQTQEQAPRPDLTALNPDYLGWIRIEETNIDYPVVWGVNNTKYLNTTFLGDRNPSGTIFMDNRSMGGFSGYAVLHGHNMRDGSMFAGLYNLLDPGFQNNEPEIEITTSYGETFIFKVFDVSITNVNDKVFTLLEENIDSVKSHFIARGISENASILILSTCTTGHRDERLVVQAYR